MRTLGMQRERLGWSQRLALMKANGRRNVYLGIAAACLLPTVFWTFFMGVIQLDANARVFDYVVAFFPLLLTVGVMATGLPALRRRYDRLEESLAADPPVAPGWPATCHTCGGDLDASLTGLATCRYCGAENLSGERALGAAVRRRSQLLHEFIGGLQRRKQGIHKSASQSSIAVGAMGCVTPLVAIFVALVFGTFFGNVDESFHDHYRYGLLEHEGRRCVVEMHDSLGRHYVDAATIDGEHRDSIEEFGEFDPHTLVGQEVYWLEEKKRVKVLRLVGNGLGQNRAWVDVAGKDRPAWIYTLCLVPPAANPSSAVPSSAVPSSAVPSSAVPSSSGPPSR